METTKRDCQVSWREVDGKRVPYGRLTLRAVRQDTEFPVDEANHRMWFRASVPGDPGDRMDIPVKAWKQYIKNYLEKNPTFIWSHQYIAEGFPSIQNVLGHAMDYRLVDEGDEDRDGLYLLDDFAYDINPIAQMAWHMYMRRDLNAVSVGWDTLEYHTEDRDGNEVWVIDTAMLLEHSGCILPADPNALAQGRDVRAYMLSKAGEYKDIPEIAEGLKRVLGDAYCSALFCNRVKPSEEDAMKVGAETDVCEEPDRIGEILERLERIEARLDSLDMRIFGRPPEATDDPVSVTAVEWLAVPGVREVVEIYSDLSNEELSDRVHKALEDVTERLTT